MRGVVYLKEERVNGCVGEECCFRGFGNLWILFVGCGRMVWGEITCRLVLWRQGFRHPSRNERMGWFVQFGGGGRGHCMRFCVRLT